MSLPFSLRDAVTLDAISLLGINLRDLEDLPLQHFLKTEPNESVAKQARDVYLTKRNALIKQIQAQRKLLLPDTSTARAGPDLLLEKHLLALDSHQLEQREQTNKAILRKLAILQLRQANKLTRCEAINAKVDEVGDTHRALVHDHLTEAHAIVEHRDFSVVNRDIRKNLNDCLFWKGKTKRMVDHDRTSREFSVARSERLEKEGKEMAVKIIKVQNRQIARTQEIIADRQKRVDKTEDRASLIPDKMAERNRKLEERGGRRDERAKIVTKKCEQFIRSQTEKAARKVSEEAVKSRAVQIAHKEEIGHKIDEEKKLMQKRLDVAKQIFDEREEKLREYGRMLDRRDIEIDENRSEKGKALREKLTSERFELEKKTAAIRRARGANDLQKMNTLRQKIARNSAGIDDVRKQRAQNKAAFDDADEEFAEMRTAVVALVPELVGMDQRQKRTTLMEVLHINEKEAMELLEAAELPASIH